MTKTRTITSLHHELVKDVVRLRQNRDYRYERGMVVIEGIKTVSEVCKNVQAEMAFTTDPERVPGNVKETILVNEAVMQKISGVLSPEGLVAVVAMPKKGSFKKLKRVLLLDGINDPGNLGTLLRTALAFNWQGVFLLPGCADPYNDKALRASRGAPFYLQIIEGAWKDLEKKSWKCYAADLVGILPNEIPDDQPILLALGSEANGLSLETQAHCQKVTIPMQGDMESLNVAVAGGILMYMLGGSV